MLEEFVDAKVVQNLASGSVLQLAGTGDAIYEISLPSKPSGLTEEQVSTWFSEETHMDACCPC